MKKKIFVGIIILLGLFIITGCGKNTKSNNEIVSFSYNYGSYNEAYYSYIIENIDGKVTYKAKGSNGADLNIDTEINKSVLTKLNKIINNNNITDWNGFNGKNEEILDGYSFSLNVMYANGESIQASGYHKTPKNYDKGHDALVKFLKTIK